MNKYRIMDLVTKSLTDKEIDEILNNVNLNEKVIHDANILFMGIYEEKLLDKLIKKGIDINYLNKNYDNALFYTNYHSSKLLIDRGINVNNINKAGKNALYFSYYDDKKYDVLINAGIDIHLVNNEGENILFSNMSEIMLEKLLRLGVDPHIINNNGENILFTNSVDKIKLFNNLNVNLNYDLINNKGESLLQKTINEADFYKFNYVFSYTKDKDILWYLIEKSKNEPALYNNIKEEFIKAVYNVIPHIDFIKKQENDLSNLDYFIQFLETEKNYLDPSKLKNDFLTSIGVFDNARFISTSSINKLKNISSLLKEKDSVKSMINSSEPIKKKTKRL